MFKSTAIDKEYAEKTLRVLQVMDKCAIRGSPIHGVSRLLLTLWPEFRKGDTQLSLCILRGESGCADFTQAGITVEDLDRSKLDPRTIIDLIKIIRRDQIGVLHCHGYGSTSFGRIAGLITNTPVIVHEHMVDMNIPFYQKIADFVLSRFTSKGIAISFAVRDFMVNARYLPADRMEIVNNCVPASYCQTFSESQRENISRNLAIPFELKKVGIVGRLDPVKGHRYFLQAAALILAEFPETCFIVVGDGELSEELKREAEELKITDKVYFLGHRKEVMEIVALFDVLAVSSLSEGFSIAIAEAMALGKPVIATKVGGIPDVVEDGKSGILVPPQNPQKMAEATIRVLQDENLAARFGLSGLQLCRDRFLAPAAASKLRSIYYEMINKV